MAQITTLTRSARTKANEAALQAHAREQASKALLTAQAAVGDGMRLRFTIELLDAVTDALAGLEGPDVTAARLSAKAGRLYPFTASIREERIARAEAVMGRVAG